MYRTTGYEEIFRAYELIYRHDKRMSRKLCNYYGSQNFILQYQSLELNHWNQIDSLHIYKTRA